jgi:predicted type IV restriction endonuclease
MGEGEGNSHLVIDAGRVWIVPANLRKGKEMKKLLGSPVQKIKSEVRFKLTGAKPISSSEIR